MKTNSLLLLLVLALAVGIYMSAFVVDETEQVVVTRFGRVVRKPIMEPGLNFKVPMIDMANRFPKNLQEWDGDPGQIPTLDKTYIWVDTFARWRIVDPIKFFQTVGDIYSALGRLDDIIDPAVRNFITSNKLIEAVRKTNRKLDTFEEGIHEEERDDTTTYAITVGREQITRDIMKQAQPKLDGFGIELVDVKIKRINYVEKVQESVYNRMVAERNQIAEKFRSEGAGEAQKIRGDKEKELKIITSEAYRQGEELKGKADAEAIRIYADAYQRAPEFYSFMKTLETYKDTVDSNTSVVLSTDSEFMKYLKGYKTEK
ncbi:MAG: HflC protein [Deltaproteobacteria bacterium]|nr:MAG: HflC protein [Deltaproteobacteria bacterium]